MAEFARRKINFTAVKVNDDCNIMINVMKDSYASVNGSAMNISDLANAVKTKSAAEVTKEFIKQQSYILRAAIGAAGGAVPARAKALPALWDLKKFAVNQILSQTTYYNVTGIDGNRISVNDQHGN